MNHYWAYFSSGSPGGGQSWIYYAVGGAAACFAGPLIAGQLTKIRGPVVPGTARVLSLRQYGSAAVNGPVRMICRIRLLVQPTGSEPYDITVWRNIAPWNLGAVRIGRIVAVEISSKNPKKVRINLTQTISPPRGTSGPTLPSAIPVVSAAELMERGQRLPGVLKSYVPTGTTPRGLGRSSSRTEFADAPHYLLEVELHFPNLDPVTGRAVQPVPCARVPSLAVGLLLVCVVDPADPSRRFVVDWNATSPTDHDLADA
jgi:hypothetical protein